MKHILCFGDSNTHGYRTDVYDGRYDYEDRWTIKLGGLLGPDYHIIEDGLNGRTTVFADPFKPGKRGIDDVYNISITHKPLDLVIIMLGCNDTKQVFNATTKSIAYGLGMLVAKFQEYAKEIGNPKILIVSPIHIEPGIDTGAFENFDISAHYKSLEFAKYFKHIADKMGCAFFDAAPVAHAGADCLHLTKESHDSLAKALAPVVRELLG